MPMVKMKQHQTENIEVGLVLDALKQRYGYDFTGYARASLKRRLLALTEYFDMGHMAKLIPTLLYDEAVAQAIINSISVPTSEFFRDPPVWKAAREIVLPELASFPRIDIWQAGSGSGEETYTLAILLHEAGLAKRMRIFTTDFNQSLLADARKGQWPRRHFAQWRENYQRAGGSEDFDSYFAVRGDTVCVRDELKRSIEFMQHNLVTDDVFKEVQWVVCRNVLIYFGEELQNRVLRLLSRSLERGGYLLLGRSETVLDLEENFSELKAVDDLHRLYRKMIVRFPGSPHV